MKCPNCGSSRCRYVVSRKKYWGRGKVAKDGVEPRTDFHAECRTCGWKGEIKPSGEF